MNDDRLLTAVRAWLQDGDPAPPDAEEAAREIRARLPEAHGHAGWRSWRPRWASRASHTADPRPSPTTIPLGRAHTVTGRTSLMLSPSRIIAAGIVTLAVGSAIVVARPSSVPSEPAPGAQDVVDVAAPVAWTATEKEDSCQVPATSDVAGPVAHTREASCGAIYAFSDPRLEGTVTFSSNVDEYVDDSRLVIESVAMSIENDEGAWRMDPIVWAAAPLGSDSDIPRQAFLIGEGAYEGLVAVVEGFRTDELHGFILEGGLPPAPGNARKDPS